MKRYIFTMLLVGFVFLGFVGQSVADLTVTNEVMSVWGNKRVVMFDLAFDSSYAYGGETLTKASRRMADVDKVIVQSKNGYTFEYDETNEKVKVFAPAPAIVYEEQHTIADNLVTLNYPAAFLINVAQANDNIPISDADATTVTGQCRPYEDFAAGAQSSVTFFDSTGVVYVTYVTQAWKEVWDNLVQGETVTVTSNLGTFANQAVAVQSIRPSGTTTAAALMLDKDDTAATTETELDWSDGSGTTTSITFVSADAHSSAVVTYIKKPSSGFLYENFVEEETATLGNFASGVTYQLLNYPVLLWSYAGQIPINAQTTQSIVNRGGTLGAAEADMIWDMPSGVTGTEYGYIAAITNQNTAMTTATYVRGRQQDIPFLVPLEVRDAQDLSALTGVQVIMIGR